MTPSALSLERFEHYFSKGRCGGARPDGRYCRDMAGPDEWCINCAGFYLLSALTALRSELEQVRQERYALDQSRSAWMSAAETEWKSEKKRRHDVEASLAEVRQQLAEKKEPAKPTLYKGHIDSDCEVYRGVGGYCTCQTPEEKAEDARERAENEAERDLVETACENRSLEKRIVERDGELTDVRQQLANWRSWAQFVYLGGGPPVMGDVLMREEVARRTDTDLDELKNKLTRSQYEVQALGQILHDVEGQLAAERDEFSTLLRSQILISETKNTLLRKRLAQQDETLKGLREAAEMLWVVLANVSGGAWTKQSTEWQDAAARWRDNFFHAAGLLSPPPQEPHDDGLSETERRHAADCRRQEAQRQREADALQAGFELGRAPQEPPGTHAWLTANGRHWCHQCGATYPNLQPCTNQPWSKLGAPLEPPA